MLDVHPVERGDVFGYRGRSAPKSGHLLIVSGGTAHGIGLESPMGEGSLRSRAATIARGGLDAVGFVRSPYTVDGKQRLFAEPPHMQASMLFLPRGPRVPEVGDQLRRPGALHRHHVRPGGHRLISVDGVELGPQDVARHDPDQVQLSQYPHHDRQPVEPGVATAG